MGKQFSKFRSSFVIALGLIGLGALANAGDKEGYYHDLHQQASRYRYHDGQWHGQGDLVVASPQVE